MCRGEHRAFDTKCSLFEFFLVRLSTGQRLSGQLGAEMAAGQQGGQDRLDGIFAPAVWRIAELTADFLTGLAGPYESQNRLGHRMCLGIPLKGHLVESSGGAIPGFLEHLGPTGGIAFVEPRVEAVQDLQSGLSDSFLQPADGQLMAAGKEKAGAFEDLFHEILDALFFGLLPGSHGLPAFFAFLRSGVPLVIQRFLRGLRRGDGIFDFVGIELREKKVERRIIGAQFANIRQDGVLGGGETIANPKSDGFLYFRFAIAMVWVDLAEFFAIPMDYGRSSEGLDQGFIEKLA